MDLKDLTRIELKKLMESLDFPGYRADQAFSWIYQKNAQDWSEMTNLPKDFGRVFAENGVGLFNPAVIAAEKATDGTIKYLFELQDGQRMESVYLPEPDRKTVCVSTQAGCAMGCLFCATGQLGLIRNLTVAEIVDQPLRIGKMNAVRIDNLVIMGQGEPFANYDALLKAIRIINDPLGMNIGARHITISTCGLVPSIIKLASEALQVNLAISLHAATEELRNRLMPINRRYPIRELMDACRVYLEKTGRRITFEYVMVDQVNDRNEDLQALGQLLKGLLCHVNLIPFNPVPGLDYQAAKPGRIREFATKLKAEWRIETTIRKERGGSLAAACGQLQGRVENHQVSEKLENI